MRFGSLRGDQNAHEKATRRANSSHSSELSGQLAIGEFFSRDLLEGTQTLALRSAAFKLLTKVQRVLWRQLAFGIEQ
jgi:hypothetical protein